MEKMEKKMENVQKLENVKLVLYRSGPNQLVNSSFHHFMYYCLNVQAFYTLRVKISTKNTQFIFIQIKFAL